MCSKYQQGLTSSSHPRLVLLELRRGVVTSTLAGIGTSKLQEMEETAPGAHLFREFSGTNCAGSCSVIRPMLSHLRRWVVSTWFPSNKKLGFPGATIPCVPHINISGLVVANRRRGMAVALMLGSVVYGPLPSIVWSKYNSCMRRKNTQRPLFGRIKSFILLGSCS